MRGIAMLGILLLAVFIPGLVLASPYLTCDAIPSTEGVTTFQLTFNGTNPVSTPAVAVSGGVAIMYDLAIIPVGTHTVTARACRDDATWGQECSDPSDPFTFTRPAKPRKPVNIRLAK